MFKKRSLLFTLFIFTSLFTSMFLFSSFSLASTQAKSIAMGKTELGLNANAPTKVAADVNTNTIYAINENSKSISVINASTNELIKIIPLTFTPKEIAVYSNPATGINNLYVTSEIYTDQEISLDYPKCLLYVIDSNTNNIKATKSLGTIEGLSYLPFTTKEMVVDQNAKRLYIISEDGGLLILDCLSTATIKAPLGVYGSTIDVNQNTSQVYIGGDSKEVKIYDGITDTYKYNENIPISFFPKSIRVNSSTNKIYVSGSPDMPVAVINGSTRQINKTVQLSSNNNYSDETMLAINESNNRIYCGTSVNNDPIYVIDGSSDNVIKNISIGGIPLGIDALNNNIYVTKNNVVQNLQTTNSNTIDIIDSNSGVMVKNINALRSPGSFITDQKNNKIYLTDDKTEELQIIDLATFSVTDKIKLSPRENAGHGKYKMDYNPNSNKLFVSNSKFDGVNNKWIPNVVSVINLNTKTIERNIEMGGQVDNIAFNKSTNYLYVGDSSNYTTSVINVSSYQVIATINSYSGEGMVINDKSNRFYFPSGNTISVGDINPGSPNENKIINTYSSPDPVRQIVINPTTNKLYALTTREVRIYDCTTNSYYGQLASGTFGKMSINEFTNTVYLTGSTSTVTNYGTYISSFISLYDTKTQSLISTYNLENGKVDFDIKAINSRNDELAVLNKYKNNITIITDQYPISTSHVIDKPSNDNTVDIDVSKAVSNILDVNGYCISWTKQATDDPGTVVNLPGSSTLATSSSLGSANWYFHLKILYKDGSYSRNFHVGPFVIDTIPPTGTIINPSYSTDVSTDGSFMVKWQLDDLYSNFDSLYRVNSDTSWTNWFNYNYREMLFTGTTGNTYYFKAGLSDGAGNTSEIYSNPTVVPFNQSVATYSVGWINVSNNPNLYLGDAKLSYTQGSTATYSFVGAKEVSLIATTGNNMGIAKVFIGTLLIKTIDLYSPVTKDRQVFPIQTYAVPNATAKTLKVRVTGTKNLASTGKNVQLDGIAIKK